MPITKTGKGNLFESAISSLGWLKRKALSRPVRAAGRAAKHTGVGAFKAVRPLGKVPGALGRSGKFIYDHPWAFAPVVAGGYALHQTLERLKRNLIHANPDRQGTVVMTPATRAFSRSVEYANPGVRDYYRNQNIYY